MNILYLVGNGFDLAQNLKTSYQHFYQYLSEQGPTNAIEAKMLEQIKGQEHEKWSDLECALGKFTKEITDKDKFEDFYYELCDKLRSYLIDQTTNYESNKALTDKYIKDLVRPDIYLTPREQSNYKNFLYSFTDTRHINIISFNYTDTIDKCLDVNNSNRVLPNNGITYELGQIVKIHGTLGTPYLIMGVNDESQIDNTEFAKDEDVLDYMVKPRSNYEIGSRIEERAANLIDSANLIVTMGLSFGNTDKVWWQTIGKRLNNSSKVHVLIFSFLRDLPKDERRKFKIKREIQKEFLSKCGIDLDIQPQYSGKVIVCLNQGLFSPNTMIYQDDRKGL